MAYRFKKKYEDAIIEIPSLRLKITKYNITDELAQKIMKKFPQFAHNIEFVQEGAEDQDTDGEDSEQNEVDLNKERTEYASDVDPNSVELNPPTTEQLPDIEKVKTTTSKKTPGKGSSKNTATGKKSGK